MGRDEHEGAKSMDALFVVNPAAGGGRGKERFENIRQWAAAPGRTIQVAYTEEPGHARTLAQDAAAAGWERVVAVGGDGTVSEVAAGLAHTDTLLGVVPTGTGCDFARSTGIPLRAQDALAGLWHAQPRPLDLGFLGERPFVNAAGLGFDAAVAEDVNRMKKQGHATGTWTYLLGVGRMLRRFDAPQARVAIDGGPWNTHKILLLTFANGSQYAGGMRIAPGAVVDDEHLDLVVVTAVRPSEVVPILPAVFLGRHVHHPKVRIVPCTAVSVEVDRSVPMHCDGEEIGSLEPGQTLSVTLQPHALQYLLPNRPG